MKALIKIVLFVSVYLSCIESCFCEIIKNAVHYNWESYIYVADNNVRVPRISCTNNSNIIVISFFPDGEYAVFIGDSNQKPGNYGDTLEDSALVRIDEGNIFNIKTKFECTNGYWLVHLGRGLNGDFIEQTKAGHTLRIKLFLKGSDDALYFHFSLKGFTAAYNRALSFVAPVKRDEDYF